MIYEKILKDVIEIREESEKILNDIVPLLEVIVDKINSSDNDKVKVSVLATVIDHIINKVTLGGYEKIGILEHIKFTIQQLYSNVARKIDEYERERQQRNIYT